MSCNETYDVVRKRIGKLIERHGSLRKCAKVLEISPAYLSRLQTGEKDEPSDALLRKMGLRRVTSYKVVKKDRLWNYI
jgi:transcriptional regulator with XRE-family HTH domain